MKMPEKLFMVIAIPWSPCSPIHKIECASDSLFCDIMVSTKQIHVDQLIDWKSSENIKPFHWAQCSGFHTEQTDDWLYCQMPVSQQTIQQFPVMYSTSSNYYLTGADTEGGMRGMHPPHQHIAVFCTWKISPIYEPQYTVDTRYDVVCRSSICLSYCSRWPIISVVEL